MRCDTVGKKIKDWLFGETKHRYINGGKGVISIFLALLMIPFVIQADVLVEVSRYHAVLSALEEIMDFASSSVLAEYDQFVLDRFGILTINQGDGEDSLQSTYENYFNANLEGSRIAWQNESITAQGLYPLSDRTVLKNQILEAAKYGVPTEMASDMLVSSIQQILGKIDVVKNLSAWANAADKTAGAVGAMADVVTVFEDLKKEIDRAEAYKSTYQAQFQNFRDKVNDLVAAMREVTNKTVELNTARNEKSDADRENDDLFGQITSIENEIAQWNTKLNQGQIDQETYQAAVDTLNETLDSLRQQKQDSDTQQQNANTGVTNAQNALNTAQSQAQQKQDDLRSAMASYSTAISNLSQSLASCVSLTDSAIDKINGAISSTSQAYTSISNIENRNNNTENQNKAEALEQENERLEVERDSKEYIDEQQDIQQQIDWNETLIDYYKKDTTYNDTQTTISNTATAVQQGVGGTAEALKYALNGCDPTRAHACIELLDEIKRQVDSFPVSSVTKDYVLDESVYYIEIPSVFASKADVDQAIQKLNEDTTDKDDGSVGFWALMKGLGKMMNGLFKINLFYDGSLNAVIKSNLLANEAGGIDNLISALGTLAADMMEFEFGSSGSNPVQMMVNKLLKLRDIIYDIARVIECLAQYVTQIATGFANTLNQLATGLGDKIVLAEYFNLSCANRTTFTKSNPLTGYKFSKAGMGEAGSTSQEIMKNNALVALVDTVLHFGDGSDEMFRGAECEFLLKGSRSELANQSMVFFDLYILRLAMDVAPILNNAEFQAIKAAADAGSLGVGGLVVLLLYILLEPFVDTIILVNGAKIDLFSSNCIYLVPSGLPTLIGRLIGLKLNDAQQDEIMAQYSAALHQNYQYGEGVQTTDNDGNPILQGAYKDASSLIRADYGDYLFIYLLCQDNEQTLKRFQSLLYLEAKKNSAPFELNKAYTYVSASAKGKYKPFLSAAEIYTSWTMSGTKNQVRGY